MCGRTGLSLHRENLRCACSYKDKNDKHIQPAWLDEYNLGKEYSPSYNIAPTEVTPVLVSAKNFQSVDEGRVLKPMMWGMVPPWHKGNYKTHGLSTNNCRLESIESSKLYGQVLREGGRCVVIAEGFYEWQTTKKEKVKQPYYIYMPQKCDLKVDDPKTWSNHFNEETGWTGIRLLHMAALYNCWESPDGPLYTYSVITMESNSTMDWLHHRMPAILDTDEIIQAWLDTENTSSKHAVSLLKPVDNLSWHPVSTLVNNAKNKSEACNQRIILNTQKTTQKTLTSWFTTNTQKRKSDCEETNSKKSKF